MYYGIHQHNTPKEELKLKIEQGSLWSFAVTIESSLLEQPFKMCSSSIQNMNPITTSVPSAKPICSDTFSKTIWGKTTKDKSRHILLIKMPWATAQNASNGILHFDISPYPFTENSNLKTLQRPLQHLKIKTSTALPNQVAHHWFQNICYFDL